MVVCIVFIEGCGILLPLAVFILSCAFGGLYSGGIVTEDSWQMRRLSSELLHLTVKGSTQAFSVLHLLSDALSHPDSASQVQDTLFSMNSQGTLHIN